MQSILDHFALHDLCRHAAEVDLSAIPSFAHMPEPDDPYTASGLSEGRNITRDDGIERLTLPCPVLPPFVYRDSTLVSALLGISQEEVNDILHHRRAVLETEEGYRIIPIREYWEGTERSLDITGATALVKLLERVELAELDYALQQAIFAEKDPEKRNALWARRQTVQSAISIGLDPRDLVYHAVPILPEVIQRMNDRDGEMLSAELCHLTYRFWRWVERYRAMFDLNSPYLVLLNERRMIQEYADRYFDFLYQAGITFRDNTVSLRAILSSLGEETVCGEDDRGVYCRLPIRFPLADNNLTVYISPTENGFDLSDGGFVIEYLRDMGIRPERYEGALRRVCREKELRPDGNAFTAHISGHDNPIVMTRGFSSFLQALTILAHIEWINGEE